MDGNEHQISEQPESTARAVGSFVRELGKVFLIALAVIIPLRVFIAEPFIVSGDSMVPNFHNREYLIIDKLTYRFTTPKRQEAIVFKYPKNNRQYFIKRIIGLPGETLKIDQGHVIIYNQNHPQGQALAETYLPKDNVTFGNSSTVTLGTDEYFVLGDNRLAWSDSRVWGVLPKNDIVGKVWLRVFPLSRFDFISTPTGNIAFIAPAAVFSFR